MTQATLIATIEPRWPITSDWREFDRAIRARFPDHIVFWRNNRTVTIRSADYNKVRPHLDPDTFRENDEGDIFFDIGDQQHEATYILGETCGIGFPIAYIDFRDGSWHP